MTIIKRILRKGLECGFKCVCVQLCVGESGCLCMWLWLIVCVCMLVWVMVWVRIEASCVQQSLYRILWSLFLIFIPSSLHDVIRMNTYTVTLICHLAVPLIVCQSISMPRSYIDLRMWTFTFWFSCRITRMQCNCTARLSPNLQRTHTYSLLRTSRWAFEPHATLHLWFQSS